MEKEISLFVEGIGAKELSPRIPNSRQNYFVLNKIPLIVKISRLDKPFWGVGGNYIDFFNSRYQEYLLVLLISKCSGWFFRKKEINNFITTERWRLRITDNNYKIILPLPDNNRFYSESMFLSKIRT